MREANRQDERDQRDHPNNEAARWHLNRGARRGLLSGAMEPEDKNRKRLDIDGTCICRDLADKGGECRRQR